MKRFKFLLIISLILFLGFSSCNKDKDDNEQNTTTLRYPIAAFSFSGNDQAAPTNVKFNNNSQYANKYKWTFGDNGVSFEHSPSHTYYNNTDKPKLFYVSLLVEDTVTGLTNARSQSVSILPKN